MARASATALLGGCWTLALLALGMQELGVDGFLPALGPPLPGLGHATPPAARTLPAYGLLAYAQGGQRGVRGGRSRAGRRTPGSGYNRRTGDHDDQDGSVRGGLDPGSARRPDFARLRKQRSREQAASSGGKDTDWGAKFDAMLRQKKMDLADVSIDSLENKVLDKVLKKKYVDEDPDEPFHPRNTGVDSERAGQDEPQDTSGVRRDIGTDGEGSKTAGQRNKRRATRGDTRGQAAEGGGSWAQRREEMLRSVPKAASRRGAPPLPHGNAAARLADDSGRQRTGGAPGVGRTRVGGTRAASDVVEELVEAGRVPAWRERASAGGDGEDDAEARALELFAAWKAKKAGEGGNEGESASGGLETNIGAEGVEIDDGVVVISKVSDSGERPVNVKAEWLLDLDTNPAWLADVEFDDEDGEDDDTGEARDEDSEVFEDAAGEGGADLREMGAGGGASGGGSARLAAETSTESRQTVLSDIEAMDEDDREFFAARGLLPRDAHADHEVGASEVDTTRIALDDKARSDFEALGLTQPTVLSCLDALGFRRPTLIQDAALPALLDGRDIVLHAHTGSGKTLAFLLPVVELMLRRREQRAAAGGAGPSCLILAPSRELAIQIFKVAEGILEGSTVRAAQAIGGANINRQMENIRKKKPDIVVGTPGRVSELACTHAAKLKLSCVRYLIVDEVDQCLGSGMKADIDRILKGVPKRGRQTVFASATGNTPATIAYADAHFVTAPLLLDLGGRQLPPQLRHVVLATPRMKKIEQVRRLLNLDDGTGALVFVNDQRRVGIVCDQLLENGIIAAPLTGEESRGDRTEVMRRLREGRLGDRPIVVCTEIAARGIDVPGVNLVVNLDLPTDAEHYVHRAGRTARGGREGTAVSLCEDKERWILDKFAKALQIEMREGELYNGKLQEV